MATVGLKVMDCCLRLVRKSIAVQPKKPDLEQNSRAASFAAAAAEMLRVQRSEADAVEFVDKFAKAHRRHPEFVNAFTRSWQSQERSPAYST